MATIDLSSLSVRDANERIRNVKSPRGGKARSGGGKEAKGRS